MDYHGYNEWLKIMIQFWEEAWETTIASKEGNKETEKLKIEIEQLKIENIKLVRQSEEEELIFRTMLKATRGNKE